MGWALWKIIANSTVTVVHLSVPYSLIFVQNTEGVKEREVSSDALEIFLRNITIMVMVIIPEDRLSKDRHETKYYSTLHDDICASFCILKINRDLKKGCLLTSTTFWMCLLTTEGSGLVVTAEAQSRGAKGLFGVVGEVGCEDRCTCTRLNL